MVLVMTQFLFQKIKKKTFGEMNSLQKYKIDHRFIAFQKIKKFL
jgi:XTP/dITP diphosphohydrolase